MLTAFGLIGASGASLLPGSYDLISTTVLSSSAASVTFDVSSLASSYKHLQIRTVNKGDTYDPNGSNQFIRFNSDSNANYSNHYMDSYGSGFRSGGNVSTTQGLLGASSSVQFQVGTIQILDAFNTLRYKTAKTISGNYTGGTYNYIGVYSSSWRSTNAITSISLLPYGSNFIAGSRFSIYGIRG